MACDLTFERAALSEGWACVVGVDEAGRGPLAGPVMAGAVVLPDAFEHEVLNDSKQLTEKRREALYDEIAGETIEGLCWASGMASEQEIDELNVLRATHLAMRRAVENLPVAADFALIDGRPVKDFPIPQNAIVKGDGKSLSIAAASIVAKVERDRLMRSYAEEFPEYAFEKHKGYGTKQHLEALKTHGPCRIHRTTFAPVAECAR